MKQVIVMRTDLGMSVGKMVSQGCHAAEEGAINSYVNAFFKSWIVSGRKKVVLKVSSEKELQDLTNKAVSAKLRISIVNDAGRTELEPGTWTCIAIGPAEDAEIDKITGHLELL